VPKVLTRVEEALRRAVVEIAAEKPITEVTVTEVCKRADATRDSFYRFAPSPAALLALCLYDDHDVTPVTPARRPEGEVNRELTPATRILLEHVQRNERIYRNALAPRFPLELREALLRRLETVLYAHAREFPDTLPDIQGERPDEDAVHVLVHHASNGVVGVIEFLVAAGHVDDTDRAIAMLHAATAPYWLTFDQ
jgi:AcrR family transcriptional regulator